VSRRAIVLPALAAAVPPLLLLLDAAWPAIVHRHVIRQMAAGREEPVSFPAPGDALAAGCALLALAAIAFLAATRRHAVLQNVVLLGWSVTAVLLGFELAARAIGRPMVHRPNLDIVVRPDPAILPGTKAPARFTTNGRGMRGPEWEAGAERIFAVGGSTTICFYLDDALTWPQRVMTLLNAGSSGRRVWVGNVGKSGHDTLHHLELLERLPEVAEVDVIVLLAGVNDFSHSLRYPFEGRRRTAAARVFDRGGPRDPFVPHFRQSLPYRAVTLLAKPPAGLEVEDLEGRVYARRREQRRNARKDYPLPPLDEPLRQYQATLGAIADWCRQRGIRLLLLTQPTLWQDPMPPELEALTYSSTMGGPGRTLSAADLARGIDAFNRTMLELCRTRSLECLDLASALPKDASIHYDQEHFTIEGADAVARMVAERLARRRDKIAPSP
jgi:lysophospholipase L1-like esterase